MQKTQVRSLGQEDPLEKGMATDSSILAWRIPWREELQWDLLWDQQRSLWDGKESDITENFSHARLFETSWTVAHQTLLSMGFSWKEYQSGSLSPPPGDLPDSGMEPASPVLLNCRWILYCLSHWEKPLICMALRIKIYRTSNISST